MATVTIAPIGAQDIKKQVEQFQQHLDGIERQHGYDEAKSLAELNKNSIGNWGKVWLDAHPAPAAPVATDIEKYAHAEFEKCLSSFAKAKADVEAFHAKVPMGKTALEHPDYRTLADVFLKAQIAVQTAPERLIVEPMIAAEGEQKKALDAMVEKFAVQHNLTQIDASKRLASISTDYQTAYASLAKAASVRIEAAQTMHNRIEAASADASWDAALKDREVKAEGRRVAMEIPTETALRFHVEGLQKSSGKTYEQTFVNAIRNDETAASLYNQAKRERNILMGKG